MICTILAGFVIVGKHIAILFAFQDNLMCNEANLVTIFSHVVSCDQFFSAHEQGHDFIELSVHIALLCHNYFYRSIASYVKYFLSFDFIRYRNFHYHKRKYWYLLANILTSKLCHLEGQYYNVREITALTEMLAVHISQSRTNEGSS